MSNDKLKEIIKKRTEKFDDYIVDILGVKTKRAVKTFFGSVDINNKNIRLDYFDNDTLIIIEGGYSYSKVATKFLDNGKVDTNCIEYTRLLDNDYRDFTNSDSYGLVLIVDCITKSNDPLICDKSILPDTYKIYYLDSIYYHDSIVLPKLTNNYLYKNSSKFDKCQYARYKLSTDKKMNIDLGMDSVTYSTTEGNRNTFGVEIETISGFVPKFICKELCIDSVYDGSLRDENKDNEVWGGEYVTSVLKGDSGFLHLKKIVYELSKRCTVNKKCSVHVHLGDVGFTKEYIVYLYKLCIDIEYELMRTQPVSRRKNEYCKVLKNFNIDLNPAKFKNISLYDNYIDQIYDSILTEVSSTKNYDPKIHNKKNNHPLGSKCNYNHNTARYCWLNLVPALFNTRSNGTYTVEIRLHAGTLNYIKIKNWILLCMAIIEFPNNYKTFISTNKVTLNDILQLSYPKKGKSLDKYFKERIQLFNNFDDAKTVPLEAVIVESEDYQDNQNDNNFNIKNT